MTETEIDLHYLGDVRVEVGGAAVAMASRRTSAVLALVACLGRPVTRARLADVFWPDRDERTGAGNLRVALSHLRRDVGALLHIDNDSVRLADGAASRVDVVRFTELAERGLGAPTDCEAAPLLHAARAEYRGPLLPGLGVDIGIDFEEWLDLERERVELCQLRVLERLVDIQLRHRPDSGTVDLARQMVRMDRLRESSQLLLMRAQWCTHDRAAALHDLDVWLRRWDREMPGVAPSPALADLAEAIRTNADHLQMVTER